MAWWNWSKTAASNATADGTINWAEGQPPASVNDSARAMMARLAEFRDDTSGLLTTGGNSTAYTLTTNQGLSATPNDGQLIVFSPHTTNGTNATLRADAGNIYPIQSAPGTAAPAASLVQGTPYPAKFNASQGAWILLAFFGNPFNIPIGGMFEYLGTTAPNANFALPAGQAISRTTYATLFALVGTTFGTGDGLTTFNIPDLRGRLTAALDNLNGSAANRITVAGGNFDGTVLGGTGGAQNHTQTVAEMPAHAHTDSGHTHDVKYGTTVISAGAGAAVVVSISSGGGNTGAAAAISSTANIQNTGGGNPFSILPPVMMVGKVLRII